MIANIDGIILPPLRRGSFIRGGMMVKVVIDKIPFKSIRAAMDFTGLPLSVVREMAFQQRDQRYEGYERDCEMIVGYLTTWIEANPDTCTHYIRSAKLLPLLQELDGFPIRTPAALAKHLNARKNQLSSLVGMKTKEEYDVSKGRVITYYSFGN